MADHWDYVIVGAGAAGCVLANRLSEDPSVRVLVLEAGGPDRSPWIRIPAGFTRTVLDPDIGWGYVNAGSAGTEGREIPCPRGKVLGGSSSINGHLYVRGQAQDYDDWAAGGATGWSWSEVLPSFMRAESRIGGDPSVRGLAGPLQVTDPGLRHPLCAAFIESMQTLGVPPNPDYNRGDQTGAGYYQYLIRDGRRWSAADAYLRPALGRPNLAVRTGARVTRLLIEEDRACGVEVLRGDGVEQVRAAGEVILAAGAINTPQLLQLSGIGDPEHLQTMGIPVVRAVPGVGRGLVDHYAVRIAARVTGSRSLNELARGPRLAWEVIRYLATRKGLLASAVAHAYGFLRVGADGTPLEGRPDIQLLFTPASYEAGRVGQARLESLPGLTCGVCQLRPFSRGSVRLSSADPLAAPEIQPAFLADQRDLDTLVAGVRFVRRLYATAPLSEVLAGETWPGDAAADDESLRAFARRTGSTVYHPVGSCRMGADEGAPVSTDLRLKALAGLRVVDASVMPSMVSGNTYAATIMIAERGSDFVLASARSNSIPTRRDTR